MIGIIVQARTGSSRFPRKIYEDINGKSELYRVLEGCSVAEIPHKIILAMPEYDRYEFESRYSDGEFDGAIDDRFIVYFGHPDDLIDRYFYAAREHGIDTIVRITADCPFTQGSLIDDMLREYFRYDNNGCYMGNNEVLNPTHPYPDGCDIEIFKSWMLAETKHLAKDHEHREHVTPFMYSVQGGFKLKPFSNSAPHNTVSMRFPVMSFDNADDLKLIKKIAVHYDVYGDLNKAINEVGEDTCEI